MDRMAPPTVAERPVQIVAEAERRRPLKACEARTSHRDQTQPCSGCSATPASAVTNWRISRFSDVDTSLEVIVVGKVTGLEQRDSEERLPPSRYIALQSTP